jgi:hypothetical protein
MNYPSSVLMKDEDWYAPGNTCEQTADLFELDDLVKKEARARVYGRILEEQQRLLRGLIFGGIISALIWVALGIMIYNLLK